MQTWAPPLTRRGRARVAAPAIASVRERIHISVATGVNILKVTGVGHSQTKRGPPMLTRGEPFEWWHHDIEHGLEPSRDLCQRWELLRVSAFVMKTGALDIADVNTSIYLLMLQLRYRINALLDV